MAALRNLQKKLFKFSEGLNAAGVTLMLLMTILTVIDIIARALFNSPLPGTYELIEYGMVIVLSFAMGYTQVIRGHIDIDSLVNLFPKKINGIFTRIADFLALIYFGAIAWQTCVKGISEMGYKTASAALLIVKYPFYFITAFGFAVITLIVLTQLILKDPER
ncbi:MAG TPA: TRAP transporter small permease [Anaerovoracaceae bacterium]|nr:TRAP transporter small permease [Anaerovoracaceae bacterium]